MRVTLERQPGSVAELSIEVPTEDVERAIERAFGSLAPRVKVPGFRPGKAPRAILERQIGWPALREQALEMMLPEVVGEAVREQSLEVIATPQVEVESFERLQPARIRARVTLRPEVKLGDYRSIRAALAPEPVGPDKVDESIQQIRESLAQAVPAGDRPVGQGDHIVFDLEVLRDGVAVDPQASTDMQMDVDPENLLPGLFEGVVGMSQGEVKDIPVHLPDDYRRAELAGQDVVFRVSVKEVKEHQLPELDDELAKSSGAGETLAELRQRVEERLQVAAQRDATYQQQKAALDALVAGAQMEVPEILVEDEIDREIRNLAVNLGQQGIDFEQFVTYGGVDLRQMREERREAAREKATQELALDALATAEGIEPPQEHVDAEIQRTLGDAPDGERLASSDRVQSYVRERLRLQWALLWLAATARGEAWVPPLPGGSQETEAEVAPADTYAANEILGEGPEPVAAGGEDPDTGMVEL